MFVTHDQRTFENLEREDPEREPNTPRIRVIGRCHVRLIFSFM